MLKLVVFDMAGTTVNNTFGVHDSLIAAFASEGISIDRQLANKSIAVPKPVGVRRILDAVKGKGHWEEMQAVAIHERFQKEIIRFYQEDKSVEEMPGCVELFKKLKAKGIKIGIDTGFDRRTANVIIERLKWLEKGLIDASVTSDEVEKGRPYPDMIVRHMEQFQIGSAKEVAKVGDTPADIQQGKNTGCAQVIAISSGAFTLEELQREEPDIIIHHLSELLEIWNL
ncbi:HAD family hydrolase [Rapidithrix thailandica]|uniref:HAD family hydrolase n=1 Tax=Rapidithrix thailandica TaxID=413964 RepID=A0AAW9SFE8_9BACT